MHDLDWRKKCVPVRFELWNQWLWKANREKWCK